MTETSDLEKLGEDLAQSLPALLNAALNHYREFAKTPPPEDAKGFTAHQAACKAALSHIEALLKLRHGRIVVTDTDNTGPDCNALIKEAEVYLKSVKDSGNEGVEP